MTLSICGALTGCAQAVDTQTNRQKSGGGPAGVDTCLRSQVCGKLNSGGNGSPFAVDADGWTVIQPSSDSRIIYVSSSQGDDMNPGTSEGAPVRSLSKGISMLRD